MANFFGIYPPIASSSGGGGGGSGTVTSVSTSPTQGVTSTVTNPTTTPNISIGLGNITPTSVAATGTIGGSNFSGTSSGTNTGDQTISLTGDVTGSGTGSFAATIANNSVTNAKAAQMPAHTIKGNNTGSTANAIDLTDAQVTAELNQFTNTLQGVVPGSGGGTANFLRADGTWTAPAGTGITALTGDVTATGPGSAAATLASVGTAGTYVKVTTDAKGRVISGSNSPQAIVDGGTGQATASAAFGALSPLTTKGDLLSYSTVNARLPVGTDGQVVTADSTQTLGVKWAAVPTTPNVTQGAAGLVASAGQLLGTNTNNAASLGNVGEYLNIRTLHSVGVSLTTNVAANISGPMTLTAGDWILGGAVGFDENGGAVASALLFGTSNTSATFIGGDTYAIPDGTGQISMDVAGVTFTGNTQTFSLPTYNLMIANGNTVDLYLVAAASYAGGSMVAWGQLWARRIR